MHKSPAFSFLPPEWLGEVGSTNDAIRERLEQDPPPLSGLVVAAKKQTRGKGRMGNAWHSAPGMGLTFSFLWKDSGHAFDPARLGSLPQAAALGVADFLSSASVREIRLRWPNDILAGGDKICGILTENAPDVDGTIRLIVGIGVNLLVDPGRDAAVGATTASLQGAGGRVATGEEVLPSLLRCIEARIDEWERSGFAGLRNQYLGRLWGVGSRVVVRTAGGKCEGTVQGMGENGELVLRSLDGKEMVLASAAGIEPADSISPPGHAG